MNDVVKNILKTFKDKNEQLIQLNKLSEDIETAKKIVDGTYKFCEECNDYYLAKSFLNETKQDKIKICTYEDPINSGGNEYAPGIVNISYEICPKGHRKEIDRHEEVNTFQS